MKMDKRNSSAAKAKAFQLRENVKFMKGRCTTENLTPQQTIAMIEQPFCFQNCRVFKYALLEVLKVPRRSFGWVILFTK